jgi:hypothetical protein
MRGWRSELRQVNSDVLKTIRSATHSDTLIPAGTSTIVRLDSDRIQLWRNKAQHRNDMRTTVLDLINRKKDRKREISPMGNGCNGYRYAPGGKLWGISSTYQNLMKNEWRHSDYYPVCYNLFT